MTTAKAQTHALATARLSQILEAAIEIYEQDDFGALHIFVSDGNCYDCNLEFCLSLPNITDAERDFVNRMLSDFDEEERHLAYDIAYTVIARINSEVCR